MIGSYFITKSVCLSYASSLIHSMNITSKFKSDTYHSCLRMIILNLIPHNISMNTIIIIIILPAAIFAGWLQTGSEGLRTRHCL